MACARRARCGQDAARRRVRARARASACRLMRSAAWPHRAGRRDRARRARGDDRGRLGPGARGAGRRAANLDRRRGGGSNGRTARWRRRSRRGPEALRGPQFDAAWCDELAKWRRAEDAFDMLQFGLRLGPRPRQFITTTPRPTELIKRLLADPRTAVSVPQRRSMPRTSRPRSSTQVVAALRGHATRAARRSSARSSRTGRRDVDARDHRGARAVRAAARAHRGGDRSARPDAARLGCVRDRGGGACGGRHNLCARGRDRRGARARRLGQKAIAVYRRLQPTRWSPR